jgi:hypothetical protein
MAAMGPEVHPGVIQNEDDEFEEFEKEHWGVEDEDHSDVQQWEEDWDNDLEDDFTRRLREELTKPPPAPAS